VKEKRQIGGENYKQEQIRNGGFGKFSASPYCQK
jgi:hypothetical protein